MSPSSPPSESPSTLRPTESKVRRVARIAVLALLAAWSLANVYHAASRTLREHPYGTPDTVTRGAARYEELRDHLDRLGVVRVGYTMDRPSHLVSQDLSVAWHYYTAQFALAPTVLDLELGDHTYIVGDFRASQSTGEEPPGLEVVRDFGGGVVLYRRVG